MKCPRCEEQRDFYIPEGCRDINCPVLEPEEYTPPDARLDLIIEIDAFRAAAIRVRNAVREGDRQGLQFSYAVMNGIPFVQSFEELPAEIDKWRFKVSEELKERV